MPTSDNRTISAIVHRVIGIMPNSILDLGIGYGKYGALCREYVDFNRQANRFPASVEDGLFRREPSLDWTVFILGIEGFIQYRNPLWDVYNQVRIQDFANRNNWHGYEEFDLVLMVDSLEHMPEDVGTDLLKFLVHGNRNVIVSVPEGLYPQDAVHGNAFEEHRSTWSGDKLAELGGEVFYRGDVCSAAHFRKEQ